MDEGDSSGTVKLQGSDESKMEHSESFQSSEKR